MINCVVLLSRIVQFKEQTWISKITKKNFSKKVSRQNFKNKLFRYNKKSTQKFQLFDFVHVNDKRQSFRIFDYHNNNNKSKISKRLKKFAQFVETLMRKTFFIFYIQVIEQSFENNDQIVSFSIQNIKNIFKNWLNDDFNKNITKYFRQKIIWRFQQKQTIEKSFECNIIQNQKCDKKFTFDKINKESINIHCRWRFDNVNCQCIQQNCIWIKTIDHFRSNSHRIMQISMIMR